MKTSGRTGRPVVTLLALLLLSSLLSGCAVSPPQHGDEQARELLAERGLTFSESASESGADFRGELSRQQAVQAALLNHPSIRAEYARLEIASADVVRASELLNPSLSLSWLDVSGGGSEFSIGLSQSLAGVMLRPARRRMAEAEYELLLTQRLILQARAELTAYGKDDEVNQLGKGLSSLGAGLRLRYEFSRQFAPYVGVEWHNKYGNTADFARLQDASTAETSWVAGVRFWF